MEKNNSSVMEKGYDGYVFSEIKQIGDAKVYRFGNKTGTGEMSCYNLIDGIQLTYNNLNMESAHQKIKLSEGILQIDHCLEGSYEFKLKDNERAFIGKGDLSIVDLGRAPFEESSIPMKKYIGLSLFIDIDKAQKSIDKYFPFGNIALTEIRDRLCRNGAALIIRSRHEINHIINELYKVDERVRMSYSVLKAMELLLFLSLLDNEDTSKIASFSKPVYEATQECYKAIVENPFEKRSISQLAKEYAVSESSLKRCFTYITGTSIGKFSKNNCLEAAAKLLLENTEMTVGDVSQVAGYLNQSKFTSAFKEYFKETPQQYRNRIN